MGEATLRELAALIRAVTDPSILTLTNNKNIRQACSDSKQRHIVTKRD